MKVEGRCHCGAIRYEAEIDPGLVGICHCSDCQMFSGTAYRVSVLAPKERFVLRSGNPTTYVKTADSGAKRVHSFCSICGSPVYSCALEDPQAYSLRIGCLEQRMELRPAVQAWCQSALPWARNLADVPAVQRQK